MTRTVFVGALIVLALAIGARHGNAQPMMTCSQAEQIHGYALQTLGSCEDPATQNTPLCGMIGAFLSGNYTGNYSSSYQGSDNQDDQISFTYNPIALQENWQNYLIQSALTSVADIGEVSSIINAVGAYYASVNSASSMGGSYSQNVTSEDYYFGWASPWNAYAEYNQFTAANTSLDNLSRMYTYFKAANYFFTAQWPYAFSEGAIEQTRQASISFKAGLDLHPTWKNMYFNTSFSNGTATAQLPAIFITPDPSKKLPLVIITTGTDYTKEETFLQFGRDYLARNYSVLVYEGPGQGVVIKNPPYMPFYPQWENVLQAILNSVQQNLAQYVQMDKIVQNGVSLGGYLGTRGCAAHGDRLAACLPNPPQYTVQNAYNRFAEELAESFYAPFEYVAQNEPDLLPEDFLEALENSTDIIYTLFLGCNATSQAPSLITESFTASPGVIDPELVYLAGGYAGVVSGDVNTLYTALWQGFNNVQEFGKYDIANISCPVIGFKSTDDTLLGGQEDEFFSQLSPDIQEKSTLLTFDDHSGGALHCQVGAPIAQATQLFASLNPIIQGGAPAPSAALSPATLPVLPATAG